MLFAALIGHENRAAKHRVPDYNDKNSTETKAAESKQTRTL
jgi:hypothetical protein